MGDRYILTVRCIKCGTKEEDVYYAPTCDFTHTICSKCGYITDLADYTGISYEDASNRDLLKSIIEKEKK